MATEDTNVKAERPADEALVHPGEPEQAPVVEPKQTEAPVDVEALLAAARARVQADVDAKIEAARTEAVEAERKRIAEEQRQAAMSEADRAAEQRQRDEETRLRLANDLEQAKAREKAIADTVAAKQRELDFAIALADSDLRLARGKDGSIDPALRELAFGKAGMIVAAGGGQVSHGAALRELAETSPWMFAKSDATPAGSTNTGNPGAPGQRIPPPPLPKLDPKNSAEDHATVLELIRKQQ